MIVKPMIRSNMCINSHPVGCAVETRRQIDYVLAQKKARGTVQAAKGGYAPRTVLVLGCSTGYGLASRITAAFEYGADTIGVSFEKEATPEKFGTPGFYNNAAFDRAAAKAGVKSRTLNRDAFSDECRADVTGILREWGAKADLVVYSLASPVRTDPDSHVMYRSVIRPIGAAYSGASLDMMTGAIKNASIEPAGEDEIAATIKVMGGEDWERWIRMLSDAGVLADGCRTVAYSYIGPVFTHAIYRDGTIGAAKKDLEARAKAIDALLKGKGGGAYVSVNKGLITRSSSVIPIITEYLASLFKVMKAHGTHEGCIEQMERLFAERLYTADRKVPTDSEGRIRIDERELAPDVQDEVGKIMSEITEENVAALTDLEGVRHDFLATNGFDVKGVDYEKEITDFTKID